MTTAILHKFLIWGILAFAQCLAGVESANAASDLPIQVVPNLASTASSLSFSADSKLLLSGDQDGTVKLWDVSSGRLLRTFARHSREVQYVEFLEDNKRIISASKDKTIKIWDTETGELLHAAELQSTAKELWTIAISADGKFALSGQITDSIDQRSAALAEWRQLAA